MSNQLFNSLGGGKLPGKLGNIQNLMNQFNQFKQSFQGDPKQQVQELLNSGKMSQEQYNNLHRLAQQLFGAKF